VGIDVGDLDRVLQAEPQCNAKTLLEWLIDLNPERYGERHLRTLQRRLPGYRLQWIEQEMAPAAAAPSPGTHWNRTEETPVLPDVN
jgi:hypothetical protein